MRKKRTRRIMVSDNRRKKKKKMSHFPFLLERNKSLTFILFISHLSKRKIEIEKKKQKRGKE